MAFHDRIKQKKKKKKIPFMAGITGWCSFVYAIKVVKQDKCQDTFWPFWLCIYTFCPITYSTGPLIFSRHTLPSTALAKSEHSSLSFVPALAGATNRSNVCCWRGSKHSDDTSLLPYNTSAEEKKHGDRTAGKVSFIPSVTSLNRMNAGLGFSTAKCTLKTT